MIDSAVLGAIWFPSRLVLWATNFCPGTKLQLQEKQQENRRKGDRKEREEKEEDLERDHVFPALYIYINETSIIYRIVPAIYKIAELSLNLINTFNIEKSLYKSQCFQTSQTKEFDNLTGLF